MGTAALAIIKIRMRHTEQMITRYAVATTLVSTGTDIANKTYSQKDEFKVIVSVDNIHTDISNICQPVNEAVESDIHFISLSEMLQQMDAVCGASLRTFQSLLSQVQARTHVQRRIILISILERYSEWMIMDQPEESSSHHEKHSAGNILGENEDNPGINATDKSVENVNDESSESESKARERASKNNIDIKWEKYSVWYSARTTAMNQIEKEFGTLIEDEREKEGRLLKKWYGLSVPTSLSRPSSLPPSLPHSPLSSLSPLHRTDSTQFAVNNYSCPGISGDGEAVDRSPNIDGIVGDIGGNEDGPECDVDRLCGKHNHMESRPSSPSLSLPLSPSLPSKALSTSPLASSSSNDKKDNSCGGISVADTGSGSNDKIINIVTDNIGTDCPEHKYEFEGSATRDSEDNRGDRRLNKMTSDTADRIVPVDGILTQGLSDNEGTFLDRRYSSKDPLLTPTSGKEHSSKISGIAQPKNLVECSPEYVKNVPVTAPLSPPLPLPLSLHSPRCISAFIEYFCTYYLIDPYELTGENEKLLEALRMIMEESVYRRLNSRVFRYTTQDLKVPVCLCVCL